MHPYMLTHEHAHGNQILGQQSQTAVAGSVSILTSAEFLQFSNMRTVWFISFLRAKCASVQDFEVSCVPTAYSFLRRFRYVLAAQFGKFVQPAPSTNG
jgi:hypothetical protein